MKRKIILIVSLAALVLFSGCSNEPNDYYTKTDFCKINGYDDWDWVSNTFEDHRFRCYNKDFSNETFDKGHLIIVKKEQ